VTALGVSRGFCSSAPLGTQFVRIAVLTDVSGIEASVRGKYKIVNPLTGEILEEGRALKSSRIYGRENGIQMGGEWYPLTALRLTPRKDITLGTGKGARRYRGSLDILLCEDMRLLAVNIIELEQYIKGVLYHEVSNRWPMEAMKAQAVAVRTYALYQMKENKTGKYDVTSDIYSQVYGGRSAERFRTNIAVNRTRGEIMTYERKILPAYYHASCGGYTENAGNLWKHALPPLEGVPCHFCRRGPHYTWKKNYQSKDIQDKLNGHSYKLGIIREISVAKRNESGRIEMLKITGRDGQETLVPGIQFRNIIGPNTIKSNNYEVVMKGYYFDLIGKGWGHGVGLCQWGAHQMARERYLYKGILAFYYPGVEIVNYHKQPPVDLP
jgi:stage II sporulation protein D